MTNNSAPAPTLTPDLGPAPAAPAPAPARPPVTQQAAAVVQVACLLLAVLTLVVAGAAVAGVLVRAVWPSEVLAIEPGERPEDFFRISQQTQVYTSRRQSQLDQRTAALASGGLLTGVAVAFLAVSLMLGAVRPDPAGAAPRTGASADAKPDAPAPPTAGQRLAALAPGVIALVGAIVIITAAIPHTSPPQPQGPYGAPVGVGFGASVQSTGFPAQ